MGIFCSCSAQKPGTTQDQDPTPGTAGHVSAGSDDFGNSWLSGVSASITTWISQPSSSFTTIWGKNVPESSQFSDATGSGDGTLANGQNSTDTSEVLAKSIRAVLRRKLPPSGIKKTFIAVKQLDASSMQGLKEWKAELYFSAKLSHPNLVKILGYCSECGDHMLVYELMRKGSLNYHLFGKRSAPPLSWDIRLKIAIDSARGLAYLHTLEEPIIYRDFKSSNILLDEFYNAKLSDFGLSFWGPLIDSEVSTRIAGTIGYIDPEYLATGHLHVKSDVYGFGVVVLELLTGLRAIDMKRPSGKQILADWAKPYLKNRSKLKKIMDSPIGRAASSTTSVEYVVEDYERYCYRPGLLAHIGIAKNMKRFQVLRYSPGRQKLLSTKMIVPFTRCLARKPATTQDQEPTPSTADRVSAGSDDFGNSWLSGVSTRLTTWMSHPSSSFTAIWGKNVPESSQFSDATGSGDGTLANGQNGTSSSVTVFTLAQLRSATYNFRSDMLLGRGGFGNVYKGWLKEKLPPRGIKKTAVAVKQLNSSGMQGLKEWKAEVYFLGTHSHPNIVKAIGILFGK
ncbi:KINASE CX32 putative-RELATED [Salix koriyanagi]|uniref:KINASE CX32 putative-RELATED n=1 Tax=Salix koriyanagi TaxID=2511006 RepID=A0A9Q0W2F7_9ROSI|nr:KINASE CX32 putative-RELATED [Salix koriyanagi]